MDQSEIAGVAALITTAAKQLSNNPLTGKPFNPAQASARLLPLRSLLLASPRVPNRLARRSRTSSEVAIVSLIKSASSEACPRYRLVPLEVVSHVSPITAKIGRQGLGWNTAHDIAFYSDIPQNTDSRRSVF